MVKVVFVDGTAEKFIGKSDYNISSEMFYIIGPKGEINIMIPRDFVKYVEDINE